jgi:hypothetical protein
VGVIQSQRGEKNKGLGRKCSGFQTVKLQGQAQTGRGERDKEHLNAD